MGRGRETSEVEISFQRKRKPGWKPPPPSGAPPEYSGKPADMSYGGDGDYGNGGGQQQFKVRTLPSSRSGSLISRPSRMSSSDSLDRPSAYDDDDDEDGEPGTHVMDKGVQYLARIFISVVAIGLLWTSSLAMIVRGLNYFDALPMPQIDDVVFFAETLYNETLRLQVSYVDCVTSNLLFCNISLELKKEREANRVVEAHAENLLTRDLAKGTKDSCYDARGRTLAAVRAWQKRAVANGRPAGLQYRDSCPYAKQQYLEQQTGDLAVEKSEHMALVKGYTGTSRETVGLLADQLQARSAYDYDYVLNKTYRGSAVDKKVQEIAETFSNKMDITIGGLNMSQLRACATLEPGGTCESGESARILVKKGQDRLKTQLTSAKSSYDSTAAAAQSYIEKADAKMADMREMWSRAINAVNSITGVEFGGWQGITGISISPTFWNVIPPSIKPSLPDIQYPDTVDQIFEKVGDSVDAYERQLQLAQLNANVDGTALRTNLDNVEKVHFGDYNPPPVNALELKRQHDAKSKEFEDDSSESLDKMEEASEEKELNGSFIEKISAFNISKTRDWMRERKKDRSWFTTKDFSSLGFSIKELISLVSFFFFNIEILDAVWRGVRTLQIIKRFWMRSALQVDPVDVTTDFESKGRTAQVLSPARSSLVIMSHPIVTNTVAISLIIFVLYLLNALYQVPFQAYFKGCKACTPDGRPAGDGTSITENVYSIAFNFAAQKGNGLRLTGLDEHDAARVRICAENLEPTQAEMRTIATEMNSIVNTHRTSQYDIELMRDCFNVPMLDAEFTAAPVLDRSGAQFELVSALLATQACDTVLSNSTLVDEVYNCDRLPECDILCDDLADKNGNDMSQLRKYSRTAVCTGLWWANSYVLNGLFIVIIWGFFNVGRMIIVGGLARLLWQFLNTGLFAFIATCDAAGIATYKREDLAIKVHAMIGKFRVVGLVLCICACGLQVPWVYGLLHYGKRLGGGEEDECTASSAAAAASGGGSPFG